MDDTDTATIELTPEEAREVVTALANYQVQESGADERRALDVREFLDREFAIEREQFASDSSFIDEFLETFDLDGRDRGHEIQLTRTEAAEVTRALADHEPDSADAETVAALRNRFEETFDLDGGSDSL